LLREQLADGSKPKWQIEVAARAAAISRRLRIVLTDALGVLIQRGQWWLPG
jgi:hypothetical protein